MTRPHRWFPADTVAWEKLTRVAARVLSENRHHGGQFHPGSLADLLKARKATWRAAFPTPATDDWKLLMAFAQLAEDFGRAQDDSFRQAWEDEFRHRTCVALGLLKLPGEAQALAGPAVSQNSDTPKPPHWID